MPCTFTMLDLLHREATKWKAILSPFAIDHPMVIISLLSSMKRTRILYAPWGGSFYLTYFLEGVDSLHRGAFYIFALKGVDLGPRGIHLTFIFEELIVSSRFVCPQVLTRTSWCSSLRSPSSKSSCLQGADSPQGSLPLEVLISSLRQFLAQLTLSLLGASAG